MNLSIDEYGATIVFIQGLTMVVSTFWMLVPLIGNVIQWGGRGQLAAVRWAAVLNTFGLFLLSLYLCLAYFDLAFFDRTLLGPPEKRWRVVFFILMPLVISTPMYLFAFRDSLKRAARKNPEMIREQVREAAAAAREVQWHDEHDRV